MLGVGASAVARPERGVEAVSASFTEVLKSNQAMVFSIAYHFLRDRTSAEEVAQDVFLQLYRNMSELRSEAHVTFWLRRVTSNRCIDFVRRRNRQATTALEDAPAPSVTNEPPRPV